jgi:tetratricopeptide (TPR) repeat protein
VWAYTRHGMAWTEKGEFEQAVADIAEPVTIDPKYAFGFGQRGQALFKKRLITKKGGWESAIADYSDAIKLDPNLLWLYSSRGVAYSNNRQYDLAVPD